MRVIGEKVNYGRGESGRRVLSLVGPKLGRVLRINSPSMAALFDIGVICGNMAASRRYGMTSCPEEKVRNARARARAAFYPFMLRRPAAEETVGKSNLSFRGLSSPHRRCRRRHVHSSLIFAAAATRSETVKPALITFRETKKKKREAEREERKSGGYALGCED